jgi:hypothetical protein
MSAYMHHTKTLLSKRASRGNFFFESGEQKQRIISNIAKIAQDIIVGFLTDSDNLEKAGNQTQEFHVFHSQSKKHLRLKSSTPVVIGVNNKAKLRRSAMDYTIQISQTLR